MRLGLIAFPGMTALDFIGFLDVVSRVKERGHSIDIEICSRNEVCKTSTITLNINKPVKDLAGFDLLFVPGGTNVNRLKEDSSFINWLYTGKDATFKYSVCTGSILLGEAGFLKEKKATTHFKHLHSLSSYCEVVADEKIVADGNIVTSGGVTSSIDLGLYFVENFFGEKLRYQIQEHIEYTSN